MHANNVFTNYYTHSKRCSSKRDAIIGRGNCGVFSGTTLGIFDALFGGGGGGGV